MRDVTTYATRAPELQPTASQPLPASRETPLHKQWLAWDEEVIATAASRAAMMSRQSHRAKTCTSSSSLAGTAEVLAKVAELVTANTSRFPSAMRKGPRPWGRVPNESLLVLREVQHALTALPPVIADPMLWLGVLPIANKPMLHRTARAMFERFPIDFHVHHFDAAHKQDPNYLAYVRTEWYQAAKTTRIVEPYFRGQTGCKLEAWVRSMGAILDPARRALQPSQRYTHMWFLDPDLDPHLFDWAAFRALIAHRAPFLAQPAVLPTIKGGRASDYRSLMATVTLNLTGRPRALYPPERRKMQDPVEVQCPIMDARLVPAFHESVLNFSLRQDTLQQRAMNRLAQRFAELSVAAHHRQPHRPAGLVFDYAPLVHESAKLLPQKLDSSYFEKHYGTEALAQERARRLNQRCIRGPGENSSFYDVQHRESLARLVTWRSVRCLWQWHRL